MVMVAIVVMILMLRVCGYGSGDVGDRCDGSGDGGVCGDGGDCGDDSDD